MEILVLSDWHGLISELPNCKPDLVISLGDVHEEVVRHIDQKFSCKKIGVLGNHDSFSLYEDSEFELIHRKVIEFNGIKIAGFNGCPLYSNKKCPQYDEEFAEYFMHDLEYVDIFVAHSNPRFSDDVDEYDAHRGFLCFKNYISRKQPKLFLHGHIHDHKTYPFDNTTIESVYPYKIIHF